jgi:histidyl-tRNA synthetase
MLDVLGIKYEVNDTLVRGIDYYTGTIFEVTSGSLGAQNAVAAGGRYDLLVEEFGGPPSPAIGFAVGMERLIMLVKDNGVSVPAPDIFIATIGKEARTQALGFARGFRSKGKWVEIGSVNDSLRSQMRRADRFGAEYVFIIGEDELKSGSVGWKRLSDGTSGTVEIGDILSFYETVME